MPKDRAFAALAVAAVLALPLAVSSVVSPVVAPVDEFQPLRPSLRESRLRALQEWMRGPSAKPVVTTPEPRRVWRTPARIEDLVDVQAIIVLAHATPEAIINGMPAHVGDVVRDARILAITEDAVTFLYRNRTFVKRLSES